MLKWFLRRWIDKFERTWNYDASYMREMLEADPRALMTFSKVQGIADYRKDVPLPAYCAAAIVSVMTEDCVRAPSSQSRWRSAKASIRWSCAPSSRAISKAYPTRWRSRFASPKRASNTPRKPMICARKRCDASASAA